MGCSNLASVTMLGSVPPELVSEEGMAYHFEECKCVAEGVEGIKVPPGTAATYKAAWQEYERILQNGQTTRRTVSWLPARAGRSTKMES